MSWIRQNFGEKWGILPRPIKILIPLARLNAQVQAGMPPVQEGALEELDMVSHRYSPWNLGNRFNPSVAVEYHPTLRFVSCLSPVVSERWRYSKTPMYIDHTRHRPLHQSANNYLVKPHPTAEPWMLGHLAQKFDTELKTCAQLKATKC